IRGVLEIFPDVELFGDCIVPVLLDPGNHEVDLLLVQELEAKRVCGLFGEVDNENVASESNKAGEDSLEDENPSPTGNARENARFDIWVRRGRAVMLAPPFGPRSVVLQLGEAVGKDSGERRRHGPDQIEDGVSLLEFEARVPTREQVGASWEKARFKDTKNQPN